jgi:hypothetical protein
VQKYILSAVIIISVILVSGCIYNPSDNGEVKTLNQNGITINYPSNWHLAQSTVNDTIASVGNPAFIDSSNGLGLISVNIQKKLLPSSLNEFHNEVYNVSFPSNSSFKSISSGNLTIGSYNGLEEIYTITESSGLVKEYRAIWIENNGYVYVILATAPKNDFENQKVDFDLIINSFKINE